MSFEGTKQALCANGHLSQWDVYDESPKACKWCKAPFVWEHTMDQTNGYDREDDAEIFLTKIKDEVRCDKCGCGVIEPVVYDVPGVNK